MCFRNMSSYLSLAAIENAGVLAAYVQPVLDSVISGNYSLSRVLPQIFAVDRELIKNHVMTLVSILPNCEVRGRPEGGFLIRLVLGEKYELFQLYVKSKVLLSKLTLGTK